MQRTFSSDWIWGCYRQHSLYFLIFAFSCCYSRHIFSRQDFSPPVGMLRTFSISCFWGCYTPHFLKIPPHGFFPVLGRKIFFSLLFPAYCSFRHSSVGMFCTIVLESGAQFYWNIRHSYTLFLNIYKLIWKFQERKTQDCGRKNRNVPSVTIIDTGHTIWYDTHNEFCRIFRKFADIF